MEDIKTHRGDRWEFWGTTTFLDPECLSQTGNERGTKPL